jgi:hypothetical protein
MRSVDMDETLQCAVPKAANALKIKNPAPFQARGVVSKITEMTLARVEE